MNNDKTRHLNILSRYASSITWKNSMKKGKHPLQGSFKVSCERDGFLDGVFSSFDYAGKFCPIVVCWR